jgi:hypothetical protein
MKLSRCAGDALANDACVFVDQYAHGLPVFDFGFRILDFGLKSMKSGTSLARRVNMHTNLTAARCRSSSATGLLFNTGGNFPFWIAPVQAVVLPVSDRFAEKAREWAGLLRAAGLRAECDDRNEKLGARIRKAELEGPLHAGRWRKEAAAARSPSA